MTHGSSPLRTPQWARCCCCHRRVPMPARLFRERSVTILVGLVRRSFNRLKRSLSSYDCVDSFILHRIVSCFSNGIMLTPDQQHRGPNSLQIGANIFGYMLQWRDIDSTISRREPLMLNVDSIRTHFPALHSGAIY